MDEDEVLEQLLISVFSLGGLHLQGVWSGLGRGLGNPWFSFFIP
jgi:hypothetical protein